MASISGGGSPPQPNQRDIDRSARYEQYVKACYEKNHEYPAMPIELSPTNGVPTGDSFHKTAEALGVPVTVNQKKMAELPVSLTAYNQLLRTIAQIVHDPLGFMKGITGIDFHPSDRLNAGMNANGQLAYYTITTDAANTNQAVKNYKSPLDSLIGYEESLRNETLVAQHEGIHRWFMEPSSKVLGLELSGLSSKEYESMSNLIDGITESYIGQLSTKNPRQFYRIDELATGYYRRVPEEFYTTLFEAISSEMSSRTPITSEMAQTVGSTVEQLEKRMSEVFPTVSKYAQGDLEDLLQLIKETPFNVEQWWLNQYELREQLCPSLYQFQV